MLQIDCPWCGPREETEFRYGGTGVPLVTESSDADWAHVLFYRASPAGKRAERWIHVNGCRQWFHLVRDTLTHQITDVRKLDDPPEEQP